MDKKDVENLLGWASLLSACLFSVTFSAPNTWKSALKLYLNLGAFWLLSYGFGLEALNFYNKDRSKKQRIISMVLTFIIAPSVIIALLGGRV